MSELLVKALYVYPVKSMKGIAVDHAALTPLGLASDRNWMVVRSDGRFVTQRDNPRMALIETALDDNGLVLSMAGRPDLHVAWDAPVFGTTSSAVWKTPVEVADLGDDCAGWLAESLQSDQDLRLVRMPDGFTRPGNPKRFGDHTTIFADAAPYLVANTATLDALNAELLARGEDVVPMNRFRPNVVVSGLPAFSEHGQSGFGNTGWRLEFRGPCERCVVTTIDQDTAEAHPRQQPFKTLVDLDPMPGNPRAPAFGQHATLNGTGVIRTGQPLDLLA